MCSDADFGRTAGPRPSHSGNPVVVVWDHRAPRLRIVSRVVAECGASALPLTGPDDADSLECSPLCCLAVIALGGNPAATGFGLDIIRNLHRLGITVISHETDSDRWSLGVHCKALLAGASILLDSGHPGFPGELHRTLAALRDKRALELQEEGELKRRMLALGMVGESRAMVSVFRQVLKMSTLGRLPVLITGETGTGKELIARALHQLDPTRSRGSFVAVNCGAIPRGLAESELFGHRKGAFTGAERDRRGLIRSADGGTLFLDEIAELSHPLQAKLLRVIQEERVLGIGDDQEVPVDLRIVCATNRDIQERVRQGEFREDLYYRVNTLSIHLPPLRERKADLEPLIELFLSRSREAATLDRPGIGRDFLEALATLPLPGNVRQLQGLVAYALSNRKDAGPLGLRDLPPETWRQLDLAEAGRAMRMEQPCAVRGASTPVGERVPGDPLMPALLGMLEANQWNLVRSLSQCEGLLLKLALRRTHGNQSQAARLLGITPRSVYNKLKRHDALLPGAPPTSP